MDETVNKVRVRKKRLDMKTIFADRCHPKERLKEIKQKLNQCNFILKEYALKMNIDKPVITEFQPRHKHKNRMQSVTRLTHFFTLKVKQTEYGKINGEINRIIQNGSKFYQITKHILLNRDPKTVRNNTEFCFKIVLPCTSQT
jgi:hypothetical protein